MAPTSNSGAAIVARADMSPGRIAGAVVGSVLGGSLLLIILGFLYFRHRRMSKLAQTEEVLPIDKAPVAQHGITLPWQGFPPGQTPAPEGGRPPSLKDGRPVQAGPGFGEVTDQHRSPISPYGDDWTQTNEGVYAHQSVDQYILSQNAPGYSMPVQSPTVPVAKEQGPTTTSDHAETAEVAANSSYYDTRISMDSGPEQTFTAPSRQMTEMYQAQLKAAEEHRKSSGSLGRRIINSFKRQRSTQSSSRGHEVAQSPTSQQYFPASPVESPISIKQETEWESSRGTGPQSKAANRLYEEPEQIAGDARIPSNSATQSSLSGFGPERDAQHLKKQKRWESGSQYGEFPLRTESAIRETTERDPELPSAVLGRTDSTYGLPPSAQPPTVTQQERLKSPDIPEPMELDESQPGTHDSSVFRGSHSPPLPPESFISPMVIMRPTNAAEKAAYTDYQMENSASPPAVPASPPDIVADHPMQENQDDLGSIMEHDFADKFLDLPHDEEPRLSGDSYDYTTHDYSTTPGQSSTDPSSGRTPDTRVTASPSPFPLVHEHVKPEPSSSPEAMRPSPQSVPLTCEECGRQFDQIHKLNHHKRYHDRKHECPYEACDKKFGTKTHLDRHINDKHVKSKAYHCTESSCPYFKGGKSFPRKDNWRRHMIKKHGTDKGDPDAMEAQAG